MASSKELPPLEEAFFPTVFIRNQFRTKPAWVSAHTDLSGQVAVVTGANSGLGFEAARQLLSLKLSTLIIVVRSVERGKEAAARLQPESRASVIQIWQLDMADYGSIQEFVTRLYTLPRVDIAILNSGLANMGFKTVPSTGHEEVFQVNYLSTALLSCLLIPILKRKSPLDRPGRLTVVNGAISLTAKFENHAERPLLKSFDDPKWFAASDRYSTSKMLCHMFVWQLAEQVSADEVIVNLADPGYVKGTRLARDAPLFARPLLVAFSQATGRSVKVGASTFLDAAITKGKESHGCFLMGWQIAP